jgi:aminopeptidase N
MGDDGFFAAMRAWIARHRHGFATGRDLLTHLAARTDADLLPIYGRFLQDTEPRPPRGPSGPPHGPRVE